VSAGGKLAAALDVDRLLERFKTMARIREFELRVAHHFREGDIHGFVHTSLGQEAVAAGACGPLRTSDFITTTHRGHGHCIAKGADPAAMMAELFGRATGICGGKGGSMHIAAADRGILGANGIVGAGIPIATGAGLAARSAGAGAVVVAFFGEGAVHSGAFHEGVVLSVAWRVPVIFVCENNAYAEFTRSEGTWGGPSLLERAAGYGLATDQVDGNDVVAVEQAVHNAVQLARMGGGPSFLEARTYRMSGHYEGDPQPYRITEELEAWKARDPLTLARALLDEHGRRSEAEAAERAAAEEMDGAVQQAKAAPYPDPARVLEDVGG
jgi:TPP-dependent pyruvate/acetoin dehydrogenase alpha subunit